MWQTVLTAAGDDDLIFQQAGFKVPKNWVTYKGHTILESSILCYANPTGQTKVLLRGKETGNWENRSEDLQVPGIQAIFLTRPTQGALCTALMGLDGLSLDEPLVVGPGDSFIRNGILDIVSKFLDDKATASTLLFSSSDELYSYARLMPDGDISEMAEKRKISEWASTGLFMFRHARDFLDAGSWVLSQNMRTGSEFFMSSSLNYLVMRGDRVRGIKLDDANRYVRLASPYDLVDGTN